MAVKTVTAMFNGSPVTLQQDDLNPNIWRATVTPEKTSYYQNAEHKYYLSVTATDNAGNATTVDHTSQEQNDDGTTFGEELKVRVYEREKPTITITAPGEGTLTNNVTPTVTATLVDPGADAETGSGINLTSVSIMVDETPYEGELNESAITNGYNISFQTSALSNGEHTITINANDNDGNAAVEVVRTFTIDAANPTLQITNPADEAIIINQNTYTITGTVTDTNDCVVKISLNGADQGTIELTPGDEGTSSFSKLLTLISGVNTIIVTATDAAGNSSSVTRTITVDTGVPVFESVKITNNEVDCGQSFTIEVEVVDSGA